MKLTTPTLRAILLRFGEASEDGDRKIARSTLSHPSPTTTAALFTFRRHDYIALLDDDAEDDVDRLQHLAATVAPGRDVTILENPALAGSFGVPYEAKDVYLFKIDAGRTRLDALLAKRHPELSRSSWKKRIENGEIRVGGAVETKAKTTVDETAIVEIAGSDDADEIDLPVLHADDEIVVIEKPAGVLTHQRSELDHEATVVDFLKKYWADDDGEAHRYGLVHRLDRDTSGVMIAARTKSVLDSLKKQFADRTVRKIYTAVVDGTPDHDLFRIDVPLGRDHKHQGLYTPSPLGKSALTTVRLVKRGTTMSLLEVTPHTGRTHQIRVHLRHAGLPIHGDRLYGKAADRLYLHATALTIQTAAGEQTFRSEAPDSFEGVIESRSS